MRTFLMGIGAAITVPILILNWIGAAVGGIWLAIEREWILIGIGIALMLMGRVILALLMAVGLIIAAPAAKLRPAAWLFLGAAGIFNFLVLTFWSVWIFSYFANRPHGNVWPYILWAYAATTMGWVHMTLDERKSDPNTTAIMWVLAVQFGAIGLMASILVGNGYQSEFGMILFFVPAALFGAALFTLMQSGRG
jgi:hypothetical protein